MGTCPHHILGQSLIRQNLPCPKYLQKRSAATEEDTKMIVKPHIMKFEVLEILNIMNLWFYSLISSQGWCDSIFWSLGIDLPSFLKKVTSISQNH